jgi:hypothetical protein
MSSQARAESEANTKPAARLVKEPSARTQPRSIWYCEQYGEVSCAQSDTAYYVTVFGGIAEAKAAPSSHKMP